MPDPLTAIGRELGRDIASLRLHADNIANMNTAGFRAAVATDAANANPPPFRQGRLQATGKPLDVAILGDGWLVVRDASESLSLTRNGALHVDAAGFLVDNRQHRVQGDAGDIRIGAAKNVAIDTAGRVLADGEAIGTLRLVATPAGGTALPGGGYRVTGLPPAASGARVAAGVLEFPDIDLAAEMTQLMATGRHLESTQRALQSYDSVLGTGIGQIGKE